MPPTNPTQLNQLNQLNQANPASNRRLNILTSQGLALTLAVKELLFRRRFSLFFLLNLVVGLSGFLFIETAKHSAVALMDLRAKEMAGSDVILSSSRAFSEDEKQSIQQVLTDTKQASLSAKQGKSVLMDLQMSLPSMVRHDASGVAKLFQLQSLTPNLPHYGQYEFGESSLASATRTELPGGEVQTDDRVLSQAGKPSTSISKNAQANGNLPDENMTPNAQRPRLATGSVWVYPEVLAQLGAKLGDQLQIGKSQLVIAGTITNDPGNQVVGFSFGPRIFLTQEDLLATGLIDQRSRVFYKILIKTPSADVTAPGEAQAFSELLLANLKKQFSSTREIRVRSASEASQNNNRALVILSDYLGLISLLGLFLAAVGTTFLFRTLMAESRHQIGVMLSMGANHGFVLNIYLYLLVGLGLLAALISSGATLTSYSVIQSILETYFGFSANAAPPVRPFIVCVLIGITAGVLANLPFLFEIKNIKPIDLVKEATTSLQGTKIKVLGWIPGFLAFWYLSVTVSNSFQHGSLFFGIFLVSTILFGFGFTFIQKVFEHFAARHFMRGAFPVSLTFAGLNLSRQRSMALLGFLAIALGALLLNVIPQVQNTVLSGLDPEKGFERPQLFLFDIQDEQIEPLRADLSKQDVKLSYQTPMIRARLVKINGEEVTSDTVEEESDANLEQQQQQRVQRRGYNLTYREQPYPSEVVTKGRYFTYPAADADKPFEVSLEERFASRLRVGLGDSITFDIQGVSVTGTVTSLRRVDWISFQPNFFVVFEPRALEGAPKTFIAAIDQIPHTRSIASTGVPAEEILQRKADLQNQITASYPNVSIIDVASTIDRLAALSKQISQAVTTIAWFSFLAGLAVILAIAWQQVEYRRREAALLKAVGARLSFIIVSFISEFVSLAFLASIAGATCGIVAAYILSDYIFKSSLILDLWAPLQVMLLVTGLTCVLVALSAVALTRVKPQLLLKE